MHLRETIDPSRLGSTWINGLINFRIKVTFFPKFSKIALEFPFPGKGRVGCKDPEFSSVVNDFK